MAPEGLRRLALPRILARNRENPMPAALRPMNLGEILDRTFEIYRRGFLLLLGIALLPLAGSLALYLLSLFLEALAPHPNLPALWVTAFAKLKGMDKGENLWCSQRETEELTGKSYELLQVHRIFISSN